MAEGGARIFFKSAGKISEKSRHFGHYLKSKLLLVNRKIQGFSFFQAVFIGIALGLFSFGTMLFAAILWLIR